MDKTHGKIPHGIFGFPTANSTASARHRSVVAEAHGGERDGAEVKGGEDVAEPRLFGRRDASSGSIFWGTKRTIQQYSIIPSRAYRGPIRAYFLASVWAVIFLSGMLSMECGLDS